MRGVGDCSRTVRMGRDEGFWRAWSWKEGGARRRRAAASPRRGMEKVRKMEEVRRMRERSIVDHYSIIGG